MYSGFLGTCISHVFSLLAAYCSLIYAQKCQTANYVQQLLYFSQILIFGNSALALVRYGRSDGYKLRKIHVITLNLSTIISLSFLQLAVYRIAKSHIGFYLATILNMIPFIYNIRTLDYRLHNKSPDFVVALNLILFLWTSLVVENYNAVAFIISFAFGYFYVKDCGYFHDTEVPAIDIFQYIQCFLCFYTVNAVCYV